MTNSGLIEFVTFYFCQDHRINASSGKAGKTIQYFRILSGLINSANSGDFEFSVYILQSVKRKYQDGQWNWNEKEIIYGFKSDIINLRNINIKINSAVKQNLFLIGSGIYGKK